MAEKWQKTEAATPKKRREARKQGQVARSPELGSWATLLLVASALPWLGGQAAQRVDSFLAVVLFTMAHPSQHAAIAILGGALSTVVFASLPIVLICTLIGVGTAYAQVGFQFTPEALSVKVSRISPKQGFSRIFSIKGLWTLGKTAVKLSALGLLGFVVMHQLFFTVLGRQTLPLPTTLAAAGAGVFALMRDVGALALVIAVADYVFQRRTFNQDLRMSRQEIRDEMRRSDGNPELRAQARRRGRELSRMRMMAAIADADVIVTNPTHYAVAIAYDRTKDRAPRVVAKGADVMAARIRRRADECSVPIVESPLLARSLHASCEVDDPVPAALFEAVARLLAFVYSLTPTAKILSGVHRLEIADFTPPPGVALTP